MVPVCGAISWQPAKPYSKTLAEAAPALTISKHPVCRQLLRLRPKVRDFGF
jgi:hypothetical protein